MDIQRDEDGGAKVSFDPRPDIMSKFHEKFVAMQALGAYCLANSAYHIGTDAAFLALRIADTKHEDEQNERHAASIKLSKEELDIVGSALRQLHQDKRHNLVVAANSGDMMNCAYKAAEAAIAKEMSEKLEADAGSLQHASGAGEKRVGFSRN